MLTLAYRLEEDVVPATGAPHGHVERWAITVSKDDAVVGDARVLVLNLEADMAVGDLADADTGTWVDRPATGALGALRHLLVLDRVWLCPEARGNGYGPIIAAAVVERLGRGCELAACFPAPFEDRDQSPADRERSVEALGALWSKAGFRPWRDGVWMIDLQHPEIQTTADLQPDRAGRVRTALRRCRVEMAAARDEDVFLHAAALAFYGLISVAPLVVVALWVTSRLVGQAHVDEFAADLARLAPRAVGVDRALERVAHLGTSLGVAALVAALWPATAYGSALIRVFNRMTGDRRRAGIRGRGAALLLVCPVPVLVLAGLVASYAGVATVGGSVVEAGTGLVLALVLGFAATTLTVAVVYRVFPDAPPDRRSALRAAVLAGGGISLLSVAYAGYLRLGTNFDRRYASDALAAVVLLGFWLFAANVLLLLGYRTAGNTSPVSSSRPLPLPGAGEGSA